MSDKSLRNNYVKRLASSILSILFALATVAVSEEPPYFTYERTFEEHQKGTVFENVFSVEIEFREEVGRTLSAYRGPRQICGVGGKVREFRAERLKCEIGLDEVHEIKKTLSELEMQRLPEKPDFSKQGQFPWGLVAYGDVIRGFAVSPEVGLSKRIDKTVEGIAESVARRHGQKWETRVLNCVGDDQPVQLVSLAELVADPQKFDGRRVRVSGYYTRAFEHSALSPDAKEGDTKKSVWVGGSSAFADKKMFQPAAVEGKQMVMIDGTFDVSDQGHMGMWPGAIQRITRFVLATENSPPAK